MSFDIGAWDLFGVWKLEFGVFQYPKSKGFSRNSMPYLG